MRIVIVEDEPRIREGLARLVRKIDPGYEIVGEAEDGLAGLRIIAESAPDVVITDVRMPDLDGLEMISRLSEGETKAKTIVVSAYSEFSYACQAISLGVSEYLLKPIRIGELTRSLKKIEAQIEAEKRSGRREEGLSLEGALYSIALGGVAPDAELRSFLESSCRVEVGGHFALVTIYLGSSYKTDGARIKRLAEAILMKASGFEHAMLESPRSTRLLLLAFNLGDPAATRAWFERCFVQRMRESGLVDLCAGWVCFLGLDGLREAVSQADACLDWNIVLGGESLIAWPDVERTPVSPISYPIHLEGAVRSALCSFDRGTFESGIRDFLRYVCSDRAYGPKDIKNSLIRFFWSLLATAREIEYERYSALAQQEILERITFAVTRTELERAAMTLLELLPREAELVAQPAAASPGGVSIVRRAQNLVSEFYSQGISLSDVAQKVGVTAEYLSAQFHRDTGMTFSAYIREFRVQKAKELLLGSDLRLRAVGAQVGYQDSRYFCRVFKEVTGQNPSDYRKANR
jgi:Response regulator containing CheY-like receiver domain and AraC-type DNA-binding domain